MIGQNWYSQITRQHVLSHVLHNVPRSWEQIIGRVFQLAILTNHIYHNNIANPGMCMAISQKVPYLTNAHLQWLSQENNTMFFFFHLTTGVGFFGNFNSTEKGLTDLRLPKTQTHTNNSVTFFGDSVFCSYKCENIAKNQHTNEPKGKIQLKSEWQLGEEATILKLWPTPYSPFKVVINGALAIISCRGGTHGHYQLVG